MSVNVLEKVLWDLSVNGEAKKSFREDAARLLARYHLTEPERRMILDFDVRGLADEGVNAMLTMGYWMQLEGSRDMEKYLSRMRSPALSVPGDPDTGKGAARG